MTEAGAALGAGVMESNEDLENDKDATPLSTPPSEVFITESGAPMKFCMIPAKGRLESEKLGLQKIKDFVERGGGILTFTRANDDDTIRLLAKDQHYIATEGDVFRADFVSDCVQEGRILDLDKYRIGESLFSGVYAIDILRGLRTWKDCKKKTGADFAHTPSDDDECHFRRKKQIWKGRREYTHEEEKKILEYIIENDLYKRVKGNAIWKDMEDCKVIPGRTHQSLKQHYKTAIISNIKTFHLPMSTVKKVLEPYDLKADSASRKDDGDHAQQRTISSTSFLGMTDEVERTNEDAVVTSSQNDKAIFNTAASLVPAAAFPDDCAVTAGVESAGDKGQETDLTLAEVDRRLNEMCEQLPATETLVSEEQPCQGNESSTIRNQSLDTAQEPVGSLSDQETDAWNECVTNRSFSPLGHDGIIGSCQSEAAKNGEMTASHRLAVSSQQVSYCKSNSIGALDGKRSTSASSPEAKKSCRYACSIATKCVPDFSQIESGEGVLEGEALESEDSFHSQLDTNVCHSPELLNLSMEPIDNNSEESSPCGYGKTAQSAKEILNDDHVDASVCKDNNSTLLSTAHAESFSVTMQGSDCEYFPGSNDSDLPEMSPPVHNQKANRNKICSVTRMKVSEQEGGLEEHSDKKEELEVSQLGQNEADQEDSDQSEASNREGVFKRPLRSRRGAPLYTYKEDVAIIEFLAHQRWLQVGGNEIWKRMEQKQVAQGRTWQSLKERFRKRIHPMHLHAYSKYGLSERGCKFLKTVPRDKHDADDLNDTQSLASYRARQTYSWTEDQEILKFIASNHRYCDVGGKNLWCSMALQCKQLKQRTWHSLKERFRKVLIRKLDQYELTTKEKDNFLHSKRKSLPRWKEKRRDIYPSEDNSSSNESEEPEETKDSNLTCRSLKVKHPGDKKASWKEKFNLYDSTSTFLFAQTPVPESDFPQRRKVYRFKSRGKTKAPAFRLSSASDSSSCRDSPVTEHRAKSQVRGDGPRCGNRVEVRRHSMQQNIPRDGHGSGAYSPSVKSRRTSLNEPASTSRRTCSRSGQGWKRVVSKSGHSGSESGEESSKRALRSSALAPRQSTCCQQRAKQLGDQKQMFLQNLGLDESTKKLPGSPAELTHKLRRRRLNR